MGFALRTACGEDFSENMVRRWGRVEKPRLIADRFEEVHTNMSKKLRDPRLRVWEDAHFNRLNDAANNWRHFAGSVASSAIVDCGAGSQTEENWMRTFVEEDPLLRSIFFFCVLDRSLESKNLHPTKSPECLELVDEPAGNTGEPTVCIYFSKNDPVRGPPFPPDLWNYSDHKAPQTRARPVLNERHPFFDSELLFVTNWSHMATEKPLTEPLLNNSMFNSMGFGIGQSNWLCLSSLGDEVLYV